MRILPDENATTCAAFLSATAPFLAEHGVTNRAVMTDNATKAGLSHALRDTLIPLTLGT